MAYRNAPITINISRALDHQTRRSIISAAVAEAEPGSAFRLYVGRQEPPPPGWLPSLLPSRFQWELDAADARTRNAWQAEAREAA